MHSSKVRFFAVVGADRDMLDTVFRAAKVALCDEGDIPMTPVYGVYTLCLIAMMSSGADADHAWQAEIRLIIE